LESETLPTTKFPQSPDYIYPKDFDPNANIEDLDDDLLWRYHDLTHIFWNKYERGTPLPTDFNSLIFMHYRIVQEIDKRGWVHMIPINNLDIIPVSPARMVKYAANLKKVDDKLTKQDSKEEASLSFSPPIIVPKEENEENEEKPETIEK